MRNVMPYRVTFVDGSVSYYWGKDELDCLWRAAKDNSKAIDSAEPALNGEHQWGIYRTHDGDEYDIH